MLDKNKLGRLARTPLKLERVERTPQWVEQAGKGGKRKFGRLALLIPSAPPLSRHMKILAGPSEPQRGRARGQ
jgi:hypothetical protein